VGEHGRKMGERWEKCGGETKGFLVERSEKKTWENEPGGGPRCACSDPPCPANRGYRRPSPRLPPRQGARGTRPKILRRGDPSVCGLVRTSAHGRYPLSFVLFSQKGQRTKDNHPREKYGGWRRWRSPGGTFWARRGAVLGQPNRGWEVGYHCCCRCFLGHTSKQSSPVGGLILAPSHGPGVSP
jgi:hypothetical protein